MRSCEIISRATPSSRRMLSSSVRISTWVVTSSAETASSSTRISGSAASARAIATRWRCPPESERGRMSARSGSSFTAAISSPTRAAISAAAAPRRCTATASVRHCAHRLPAVEGLVRVLEHHLRDAGAAAALGGAAGRLRPVLALDRDGAGVRGLEAADDARRRGLAGTALADDPERRAGIEGEADAVDGDELLTPEAAFRAHLEALSQPVHPQHRLGGGCGGCRLVLARQRCRQQADRVGLAGIPAHRRRGERLDRAAVLHDRDAVADRTGQSEVVGDEQQREVAVAPQVGDDGHHLLLGGDIQGGRDLVGQEDAGVHREGRRDHDPLQKSARQFGGPLAQAARRGRECRPLRAGRSRAAERHPASRRRR